MRGPDSHDQGVVSLLSSRFADLVRDLLDAKYTTIVDNPEDLECRVCHSKEHQMAPVLEDVMQWNLKEQRWLI